MAGTSKKARKKKPAAEILHYLVEITDWDWSFSFGIGWRKEIQREPFSDYRHLHIRGLLRSPMNLKVNEVELSFLPDAGLDWSNRSTLDPKSVGSIRLHRGRFQVYLNMPSDALAPLLQMLIGKKFKFVGLSGNKPKYGSGLVRSYRFETTIDDEDLPQ